MIKFFIGFVGVIAALAFTYAINELIKENKEKL